VIEQLTLTKPGNPFSLVLSSALSSLLRAHLRTLSYMMHTLVPKRVSHGLFVWQAAVFSAWDDVTALEKQRLSTAELALGRRQRNVRQRMCLTGWRRETESVAVVQWVSVPVTIP